MSLGSRIRLVRSQSGLNQTEFGQRIGAAQNTVSAWEKDKVIPADSAIVSICRTFNVRKDWLLTGEEPMDDLPAGGDALMELFDAVFDDIRRRFASSLSALTPEDRGTAAILARKILKGME